MNPGCPISCCISCCMPGFCIACIMPSRFDAPSAPPRPPRPGIPAPSMPRPVHSAQGYAGMMVGIGARRASFTARAHRLHVDTPLELKCRFEKHLVESSGARSRDAEAAQVGQNGSRLLAEPRLPQARRRRLPRPKGWAAALCWGHDPPRAQRWWRVLGSRPEPGTATRTGSPRPQPPALLNQPPPSGVPEQGQVHISSQKCRLQAAAHK